MFKNIYKNMIRKSFRVNRRRLLEDLVFQKVIHNFYEN